MYSNSFWKIINLFSL